MDVFAVVNRMLMPIKKRIFLLIGRAIVSAINADEKTMKIQMSGLYAETITDIERLQEYGFDSYPYTDSSEAVVVFPNGARDNGVAIVVADRDNRPTGMTQGDVIMYTKAGLKVWLQDQNKKIEINDTQNTIIMDTAGGISVNGTYLTVEAP